MGCGDEKLSKDLTQTFTAHCNAMICQQVTLLGDAEWPKVADAVIEAQNWMIDFDPVRAIAPDLLTVLALALPILQEVVHAHLLSDDSIARTALDRVASVIAKAHVKTA